MTTRPCSVVLVFLSVSQPSSLLQGLMLARSVSARRVGLMLYEVVGRSHGRHRALFSLLKFKGHQATLFIWAKGSVRATEREREGKNRKWFLYHGSINEQNTNYFKCVAVSQFKGQCWASTL